VFTGEIIEVEYFTDENGFEHPVKAIFWVETVYKGELELKEIVAYNSTFCLEPFEVNYKLLVFSNINEENVLKLEMCSGTKPLDILAIIEIMVFTKWIYAFPLIILGVLFLIWGSI